MHEKNSFITLTYSDAHLKSPKLIYKDFQDFAKRVRDKQGYQPEDRIGIFVTGEYGEKTKRPHWHALMFNYRPTDLVYRYSNETNDPIYTSEVLDDLWGFNDKFTRPSEIGDVTRESAGYVARYAAKKLIHGKDQDHDYHPISKKSSKHAIGKKYLEKHWQDIFRYGINVLTDGTKTSIPRYYEKWLKQHQPAEYERYVTQLKSERMLNAEKKLRTEEEKTSEINAKRGLRRGWQVGRSAVRKKLIEKRFQQLQKFLKGDL